MKRFIKVILIIVAITTFRLFWSCCSCNDDYFSFEYERVLISNIDNSGQWSKPSDVNIMPAAGVAFEIQIVGSEPVLTSQCRKRPMGFNALQAQDCNCEDIYIPNQTIRSVRIRTLEKLNEDYCCNADVTELFLANSCLACEDIGSFYITFDELVRRINPEAFYQKPINQFLIYLIVPVENTLAQFELEIELSNGRTIIGQTALIEIIE
ncbi:MAG: hypothetical protein JXR22_12710 [Prolixibacteraceae bacterium]|nr:hypothetical protein [Prolixibacteraceae bacterium]